MASQENESVNQNNFNHDQAVTDSVHSRFRQIQVHCDDCNIDMVGNESAIKKHFDDKHPTKEYCCYCKGKVFSYTQMSLDNSEKVERVVYHKCTRS
ncbi:uncharacterized protein LOC143178020 [Calliopsis andreniformis]|uniref:uncharacterized protein LOC143178020 n=1 Tax=Calliopsis andreniformis TaxID=337506 RepID=UPI003FCD789A